MPRSKKALGPFEQFGAIQGVMAMVSRLVFDGDVKYHLGWTSKRTTDNGKKINMNIAPNPSHLETVGAW